jgi:hypothetical protein
MHLSPRFRIHRLVPAARSGTRASSYLPEGALDGADWPEGRDEEQGDRDLADYAGAEATACLAVFVA